MSRITLNYDCYYSYNYLSLLNYQVMYEVMWCMIKPAWGLSPLFFFIYNFVDSSLNKCKDNKRSSYLAHLHYK